MIDLHQGDCLELMKDIPDGSVDMILCDLPYGTTSCKWDTLIPFDPLWKQYKRVIKSEGAIVLFGDEPFSSKLRISNLAMYKYDWVWDKVQPTGAFLAKKRPMKEHENVIVFYKKQPHFNRQFETRNPKDIRKNAVKNKVNQKNTSGYGFIQNINVHYAADYNPNLVNPKTILRFSKQPNRKPHLHPAQKPVDLLEYLIKTYTNENDLVLDNCMGSGSTGVACVNTSRDFIGMELDDKYFKIAEQRINEARHNVELF